MFDVLWNGRIVGTANILKEGLYYRFICRCNLPHKGIYRVVVTEGDNRYDLGICVPDKNDYVCICRIPCKRFCGWDFCFVLTDDCGNMTIPVMPNNPFLYLDKLEAARLQITNGQPEIIIDLFQAPQDSGQNREYPCRSVQR